MSKGVFDQLFVPFFTTKRGTGGSGLGMSIVNTLVTEKLKGKIRANSEEGQGTSFVIDLKIS